MKNIFKWVLTTIICATYPFLMVMSLVEPTIKKIAIISILFCILGFLWKEKLKQIRDEQKLGLKIYDILILFLYFILYTFFSISIPFWILLAFAYTFGLTHL